MYFCNINNIINEKYSLVQLSIPASANGKLILIIVPQEQHTYRKIARIFKNVIGKIRSGIGLTSALESLATATSSDSIRRFADSLILALERGTSLSDVLARQVQEVRNEHQTRLIEAAGKAEISLMIPVIFLILPISILFALWPSYLALGQSAFG